MKGSKLTMQYLQNLKSEGVAHTTQVKKLIRKTAKRFVLWLVVLGLLLVGLVYLLLAANRFYEENTITVKWPLSVQVITNKVIDIRPRVKQVVVKPEISEAVAEEDNKDLATYICNKFGIIWCKTALAVARSESGMRCDAIHVNADDSVDLGLWQIHVNSHKSRIPVADMMDCYKSTDYAYRLFTEQGGFQAWSAYKNGSYLSVLLGGK